MVKKIALTADSTCDLPKELQAKYNITLVPLTVTMDSSSYRDGIDLVYTDLFAFFDRTKKLPKTSAPSPALYQEVFQRLTDQDYEIIHLSLDSELSSSYNNACFIAQEFPNVHVIDTKNICGSASLMLLQAAKMVEAGNTVEEIIAEIERMVPLAHTSFVIDTLTYLYRGGRCSALAMLASSVLVVKPCIEMHDGVMSVGKKYRRPPKQLVKQYLTDMLTGVDVDKDAPIFLANTYYNEELADYAYSILKEDFGFKEILTGKAGSIISTHCGPNTIGLFFISR
ncbi:MAG: DegV family protein [Dehalococcoidales bacterium]|nr:DegV family protein [Dehalococcoidales bacterium]